MQAEILMSANNERVMHAIQELSRQLQELPALTMDLLERQDVQMGIMCEIEMHRKSIQSTYVLAGVYAMQVIGRMRFLAMNGAFLPQP